MSLHNLLDKLLMPLMQKIGDLWQRGELRPIHEHMATAVVRSFRRVENLRELREELDLLRSPSDPDRL